MGLQKLLKSGLTTLPVIGITFVRQVRQTISRVISPVISSTKSYVPPTTTTLANMIIA